MRIANPLVSLCALTLVAGALAPATPALAQAGNCCILPDNGAGTVSMPPSCPDGYESPAVLLSLNGLPPGEPVWWQTRLSGFFDITYLAGGPLGGEIEHFSGTMDVDMTGTGSLAGFHRLLAIPMVGEMHSAPHTPGTPIQSFDTDMFALQGQITGDPDFDLLRITGGTAFGMPSPGHTTLFAQPSATWAVDSFFDITYRIDFIGHPGGPLGGMSGSTTATIRMTTCQSPPVPVQSSTWGTIKRLYE